jgi:hypothetical protein
MQYILKLIFRGEPIMLKKLIQHGNSETLLELSTDEKNIILSPQNSGTQEAVNLYYQKNPIRPGF